MARLRFLGLNLKGDPSAWPGIFLQQHRRNVDSLEARLKPKAGASPTSPERPMNGSRCPGMVLEIAGGILAG